jgi:N-acyl-phosphatidylethanolamine-hydrolysing phospholipase D
VSLIPIWRGGTLGFISWAGLRVSGAENANSRKPGLDADAVSLTVAQLSHEQTVSTYHGSPSDAVQIHLDVQSRNSIGQSLYLSSLSTRRCCVLTTAATQRTAVSKASPDMPCDLAGIHFGTFIGSENESLEAVIELHEAAEEAGVAMLDEPGEAERGRIGVIDIGETVAIEVEDMMMV